MTENQDIREQQRRILMETFGQSIELMNYLCNWSSKYRYIYVETPKVACTTVKSVLQQAEVGGGLAYEYPSLVHDRAHSPLLQPESDAVAFIEAMQSDDYFRFCFVRNPFTRILSCWLDKMVKVEFERRRLAPMLKLDPERPPSFCDFLRAISEQKVEACDIHWSPQSYLLRPAAVKYSFIGRFEMFRDQFRMLCAHLGIASCARELSDSWHATNAAQKVKDYIGNNEIELIHRIYESDFRNFGYGWSPEVI